VRRINYPKIIFTNGVAYIVVIAVLAGRSTRSNFICAMNLMPQLLQRLMLRQWPLQQEAMYMQCRNFLAEKLPPTIRWKQRT